MGGRVLSMSDDGGLCGAALLFPRGMAGGRRAYTLRVSLRWQVAGGRWQDQAILQAWQEIAPTVEQGGPRAPASVVLYRPGDARTYVATHQQLGAFDIGAPAMEELPAIREIRAAIWGVAAGDQFPSDLHSAEFGPGTSLVARAEGRLVGFLLGFYRFGGLEGLESAGVDTSLCVESQVMGVSPDVRRGGLAAALKRAQAAEAMARGVGVIHWTADPLQFPNATLNFHKLRAVAGEFYPAFYPFTNDLNRVPASRLGIAWLPATAWGRAGLADGPRIDRGLARFPGCAVLNDGPQILGGPRGAPHIAVEIPADWTALQRDDLGAAAAWRAATDAILAEVVGFAPGRYLVADVAIEGERRYIVGHAFDLGMLTT
jgi:predicted GNAT superfamily acetyltransferase